MTILQKYLKQCSFLKEVKLELTRMNRWGQVAVKLTVRRSPDPGPTLLNVVAIITWERARHSFKL